MSKVDIVKPGAVAWALCVNAMFSTSTTHLFFELIWRCLPNRVVAQAVIHVYITAHTMLLWSQALLCGQGTFLHQSMRVVEVLGTAVLAITLVLTRLVLYGESYWPERTVTISFTDAEKTPTLIEIGFNSPLKSLVFQ